MKAAQAAFFVLQKQKRVEVYPDERANRELPYAPRSERMKAAQAAFFCFAKQKRVEVYPDECANRELPYAPLQKQN